MDEETVSKIMKDFHKDIRWIFHNAEYDIRVCRKTLGIDFKPYWDTMLAAYCIDENESHRLKDLHLKYCDSKDTESLTFDALFNGVTFVWVLKYSRVYSVVSNRQSLVIKFLKTEESLSFQ